MLTTLARIEAPHSSVATCATALREVVLRGEYEVGSRLPPERTLATILGVHRVTARAALAQLVAEGLLSVRQGSGYVVQPFLQTGGPELLLAMATQAKGPERQELVRDLLEVRRGLARVVLERLVRRRPDREALRRVETAIDLLERLAMAGAAVAQLAHADFEVTAAVVSATGSTALRLMLNPVRTVLLGYAPLMTAMFSKPQHNVASWRLLLEWLRQPSESSLELVVRQLASRDQTTLAALKRLP